MACVLVAFKVVERYRIGTFCDRIHICLEDERRYLFSIYYDTEFFCEKGTYFVDALIAPTYTRCGTMSSQFFTHGIGIII